MDSDQKADWLLRDSEENWGDNDSGVLNLAFTATATRMTAWERKKRGKEMGKNGKKHRESHHRASRRLPRDDDDSSALPSSAFDLPPPTIDDEPEECEEESDDETKQNLGDDSPSKFHLYQLSVQVTSISILIFFTWFSRMYWFLVDFRTHWQIAVAKGRYKLLGQVLSDVRWWKTTPPFPRRLLWYCSSEVFLYSFSSEIAFLWLDLTSKLFRSTLAVLSGCEVIREEQQ